MDASHVAAAEGSSLTWTFRLSEPMSNGGFWSIQLMPPEGRFPELDTNDMPASFLETCGIIPPDPAVPLSQLGIFLSIEFAPDDRVATVTIPIEEDGVQESSEGVVLLLDAFGDPVVPLPIELTGLVSGTGPD